MRIVHGNLQGMSSRKERYNQKFHIPDKSYEVTSNYWENCSA